MVAETKDGVASVVKEELRIFRFYIVRLCSGPEIIPHKQAVFIGEVVKNFFRALADPIPDNVDVGFSMKAEIWLELFPRDSLSGIIHAPAAAPCCNAHTVNADGQVG